MSVYVEEIPLVTNKSSRSGILFLSVRGGGDTFLARQGKKKPQRQNWGFIQHTRHKAQ